MDLDTEAPLEALAAKRAGDMEQARTHLHAYKALQAKLSEMPSSSAAAATPTPSRLQELQARAAAHRDRALSFKRSGDKESALQELANYKLAKQQIEAMSLSGGDGVSASTQEEARARAADVGAVAVELEEVARGVL